MNDHLRLISTFHYVVGGLHLFCGSFPLIHVFVGTMFVLHPPPAKPGDPFPSEIFGFLFILIGGLFVLAAWSFGICTIISGRRIAQRRWHTFSIVMAAINCMFMPFGTVLGVFTIIALTKPETKAMYGMKVNSQESTVNGAA